MAFSNMFLSVILFLVLAFVLFNMYSDFKDQFISIDTELIRQKIRKYI